MSRYEITYKMSDLGSLPRSVYDFAIEEICEALREQGELLGTVINAGYSVDFTVAYEGLDLWELRGVAEEVAASLSHWGHADFDPPMYVDRVGGPV